MELESLQIQMNINYFNNIIKAAKKLNIDDNYLVNRLERLNEKNVNLTTSITETEKDSESKDTPVVYSEDYLYKRSWTKLSLVHKRIKIKEYVNNLLIDDPDEKKKLEKKLIHLVKSKVLTKKNRVKYNSEKGQIYSIPDLIYSNGKYSINIS